MTIFLFITVSLPSSWHTMSVQNSCFILTGYFPNRNRIVFHLVKINIFGKNSHSSYAGKCYIFLMNSVSYRGKKLPGVLHYSFLSFLFLCICSTWGNRCGSTSCGSCVGSWRLPVGCNLRALGRLLFTLLQKDLSQSCCGWLKPHYNDCTG